MIDAVTFRRVIGLFCGGRKKTFAKLSKASNVSMINLSCHGISLRQILIVILTLLLIGNIEINPGPIDMDDIAQGSNRGNVNVSEATAYFDRLKQLSEMDTSTMASASREKNPGKRFCSPENSQGPGNSIQEVNVSDVVLKLSSSINELKQIVLNQGCDTKTQIAALIDRITKNEQATQDKINLIDAETKTATEDIRIMSSELSVMARRIEQLEEDLEAERNYNRKSNLIFNNIKCKSTDLVADISGYLFDTLQYNLNPGHISAIHYLPSRNVLKPILIKFTVLQTRNDILTAFRNYRRDNKATHTDDSIYITEHFTRSTKIQRKQLIPYLKRERELNNEAHLVVNKLKINGKLFSINKATGELQDDYSSAGVERQWPSLSQADIIELPLQSNQDPSQTSLPRRHGPSKASLPRRQRQESTNMVSSQTRAQQSVFPAQTSRPLLNQSGSPRASTSGYTQQ